MKSSLRSAIGRVALPLSLSLALSGCGGGGSSDDPGAAGQGVAAPQAASVPDALKGQWNVVLTYVPPFYSGRVGGAYQGDGSISVMLFFGPDGRYQHRWMMMQSYFGGNCFRNAEWNDSGTVSGAGPEYTFTPATASYIATDTCGRNEYQNPASAVPASHKLTLEQDATGWPLLRVSYPDGTDLLLEKCRRCQ